MSDDNNQKSRGPRKGGGGGKGGGKDGGKGGGPRGGGPRGGSLGRDGARGPARSSGPAGGDRQPFRGRSAGGDRPPRSAGDGGERPQRRFDTASGSPRPPREGERPFRARPAEGERAPFRARPGEERAPRSGSERPQRARPAGERGANRPGRPSGETGFERPRQDRLGSERPRRPRAEDDTAPHRAVAPAAPQEPERIAKVMARAGIASRRDSEAMIAEGRVSVNGKVIESPALDIGPDDVVMVDGEPLPARERTRLWLYHKPRGLVTTNHDPEGRPTVFEALPEDLPRVLSIGRLDINTEGLLLLTNDGGLARMLELPETGWLRRYRVRAFGSITQDRLDTLRDGVTIDGVSYGPVIARFERQQGANTWLVVDLREGKNREVKTVLEHVGLDVNRLIRVSFGPFQLGDLPEGEVDEVRSRVIKDQLGEELMAKAGVDFDAPRRDEMPAQERPAEPRRAPAGEDRPRRREGGKPERFASDAVRTPSRDDRSDKPWKRTVWRDAEAEPQRERKAPPRRGADPREERVAREAAGAVKRERGNAIADPKGRRVLVERVSAPPREEAPAKPRRPRNAAEPGRDRGDERPWQEQAPRNERPRGRGFGDKPEGGRAGPGRSGGGKDFGGKSFGGKAFGGKSFESKSFGGKAFGDKPAGGRPFGGKSSGGKPSGGRPSGGKPSGGRPPGGRGPRG